MPIITKTHLLKYRRTKIVATVGPASNSPEMIAELIAAGVNVFRLNMSHGDKETHSKTFHTIRAAGKSVGILVDLAGPKIRTGTFENGKITLTTGDSVTVTTRDVVGKPGLISSQYKGLIKDVKVGSRILLDDGTLALEVTSIANDDAICKIVHGGILTNHKGINLPGCTISIPALTEKDKEDTQLALELGADFISLSFVKNAADIHDLRAIIDDKSFLIAKMETTQSLSSAEEILDAADGIMVARGDLGVELPPEEVPIAQDQLIAMAREKMKPVIVATQMLESMIVQARPTRAEVTDVAYAVLGSADAVMLSAETATGAHPIEAVQTMDKIIRQTESHLWEKGIWGTNSKRCHDIAAIVSKATSTVSKDLMAHGIFVISKSLKSSLAISSSRPAAPIIAVTDKEQYVRYFALFWSVLPVLEKDIQKMDLITLSRDISKKLGLAQAKDIILLVKGFHEDPKQNTPSLTVIEVD